MKKIIISFLSISILTLVACNDNESKVEQKEQDTHSVKEDAIQQNQLSDTNHIKTNYESLTEMDAKLAASINGIVDQYLKIKNGLVSDNAKDAGSAAGSMGNAISSLDKSLFSAEQKIKYAELEDDLKEHAEHIGKNADKISHQRLHFSMLSDDIYSLVKIFGSGRVLYHDYCPMAKDKEGAFWISEMKDIKNPYFGSEMMNCGSVKETIK